MEISDELLHASAEKAAMLYLEEIDAVYAPEEDIKYSSRFLRHIRRMIRNEKRTPGERRFIRFVQRAAVAVLILFAGLFAMTISVEAFREQFISFITGRSSRATDFTYSIGNTEYYDADLAKTVFGYIPEGFEKVEVYSGRHFRYIEYEDENANSFTIDLVVVTAGTIGAISIDTEKANVTYIKIGGEEAVLSEKGNDSMLVWTNKNILASISGQISGDEAVRIAENMTVSFLKEK
ncbi:MAG: DUF4367 domain-containing protein [Lachnospiraceae bacterium]|nr:DUF4367 domain-containing protein [Lachnospiraceae bacterium]